jgi:hypothetical protein
MTRPTLIALLASFALFGCAAVQRNTERTFARPGLERVPLETLDVVVVAAGPPRASGTSLDVKVFSPPGLDDAVGATREDAATRDAIARELQGALAADGYRFELLMPRLSATASISTRTSSLASATSTPTQPRPKDQPLSPGTTLRQLLAASQADAILVVRAVPIDSFFIDVGTGIRFDNTDLGRQRVEDFRPVPRVGRLLAGQAFLFDRRTGLRLWTKQLPDFPEGGRLTPGHPFLAYGFVHDPEKGPPPLPDARALPAAQAFVGKMFDDFPRSHPGTVEARQELTRVDLDREEREQAFFDTAHLSFDLGPSWSLEHAQLSGSLGGQAIPDLGTNVVAPSGIVHLVPRLAYVAPGGWTFALSVPFGYAPSSFQRSYQRDNPMKNAMDPQDRIAAVSVDGTHTVGIEGAMGWARPIGPHFTLVPGGGAFVDFWSANASPATVITNAGTTRLGLFGGADLWYRPAEDSALFVRFSGSLRLGFDIGGPLIYGLQTGASVGFFL